MEKKRIKIKEILYSGGEGQTVTVKGWVRTKRESKNVVFININDGSCAGNLQAVADPSAFPAELFRQITTGACLSVTGELVKSTCKEQSLELSSREIVVEGTADPDQFPLQPKKHSLEFLREIAHLRPRTATFGAIFRVRHALIFAIHKFFTEKGFVNIHTPIITSSDAEGAGEMFRVSTLDAAHPPAEKITLLISARTFSDAKPISQFPASWKPNWEHWPWPTFTRSGRPSGLRIQILPGTWQNSG